MVQKTQELLMKSFKQYLEENRLAVLAASSLISSGAMGQHIKPEALEMATQHIKQFEKFIPNAEVDEIGTGKPINIGYGIARQYPDGREVKLGDTVTEKQAHQHLSQHIDKNIIPNMTKIPGWHDMDAHKQAALVGFAYNTGGYFYGTKGFRTITDHLKNKNWDQVDDAMRLYNKSEGKVRNGLIRRRNIESELWNKNETTPAPSTQPTASQDTQPTSQNVYSVSKGDSLSKIAEKHGTTVKDLQKLNPHITDVNKINIGDKIKTK